jgi:hypothetical protein
LTLRIDTRSATKPSISVSILGSREAMGAAPYSAVLGWQAAPAGEPQIRGCAHISAYFYDASASVLGYAARCLAPTMAANVGYTGANALPPKVTGDTLAGRGKSRS